MKLGARLQQIESMVSTSYDHIWDCCCDHGLLGSALLSKQAAPHIHFVDVVPELMRQLQNKLARFYPENSKSISNSQWHIHCGDVSALPLHPYNGKHLVIIAGVGGDLMTELVNAIYRQHLAVDIDFLLCPVHHQFTLRQQLIQLDFSLLTEVLMVENHRFYEILLISNKKNTTSTISPIGSLIWQTHTPEQLKVATGYLNKTLAHYKRMQLGNHSDVQYIIEAYSAVNFSYHFSFFNKASFKNSLGFASFIYENSKIK